MSGRSVLVALLLASAFLATSCGATSVPARLGAFSFDYLVAGEGSARPVQVFDDGTQTYLQYRPGVAMPAFVSADGDQLFMPRLQGPYVVLDAVPRDVVAQLGTSRVRITHASLATNAVQWARGGTALPRAANQWTENSYATPARGDRIEWRHRDEVAQDFTLEFEAGGTNLSPQAAKLLRTRARALSEAGRIQVVGREDGTLKEGVGAGRAAAVADHLVAAGVPRSRIAVQVAREARESTASGPVAGAAVSAFASRVYAPPPEVRPLPALRTGVARFQLRAADGNLAANLQRWASAQGWRVVVKDAPEVKVVGDAELQQTDFLAAADFAIEQARQAGYPIRAAAHGNQVLVLTREEAQ